MEIQKTYSEIDTGERLYSVLLSEAEYRLFATTRYDLTDQYKGMKDSDLLAEKKKSNSGSYIKAGKASILGSAAGALIGGAVGLKKGGLKKGAKAGALLGGTLAGAGSLASTHTERENNRFANRRLAQIQYQAKRRESKDWRSQTNNREGYTY